MNLIPYANIKTDNLKTLLFTARGIAVIGYIMLVFSVLVFLFFIVGSILNGEIGMLFFSHRFTYSLVFIFISFGVLIISGFVATWVSFEQKYSRSSN